MNVNNKEEIEWKLVNKRLKKKYINAVVSKCNGLKSYHEISEMFKILNPVMLYRTINGEITFTMRANTKAELERLFQKKFPNPIDEEWM